MFGVINFKLNFIWLEVFNLFLFMAFFEFLDYLFIFFSDNFFIVAIQFFTYISFHNERYNLTF